VTAAKANATTHALTIILRGDVGEEGRERGRVPKQRERRRAAVKGERGERRSHAAVEGGGEGSRKVAEV
jgi:hypothetical protein